MVTRDGLVLFLVSASVVGLELAWTRLFSAEFYYTFAFLVLSLAVLGLGLGALALRLLWPRDLPARADLALAAALALSGVSAVAGPPLVFRLGLNVSRLAAGAGTIANLACAILLLGSCFFFAGAAVALVFRRAEGRIAGLYAADLAGAGVGVLLAVALMNAAGTPAAAFLLALPAFAAAARVLPGLLRLVPGALALGSLALAPLAPGLLAQTRSERMPVVFTRWDALAKLRVLAPDPEARVLNVDHMANTTVRKFDGDWDRPDREPFGFALDVSALIAERPGCVFLSLGAGGGADVLHALQAGATEVHAVEVNPAINDWMTRDGPGTPDLATFSGKIYLDPRVRVVTEDARAYLARRPGTFDVVYSLSSNTFAALASGSFALAENYLFTTEAYRDAWRALTPRGVLVMEHQFYMPRLVPAALDALREEGVERPEDHLAVYELPRLRRKVLVLSRPALTGAVRATAIGELGPDRTLLVPAPGGAEPSLEARIVAEGWRAVAATAPFDVSPTRDDRPFVGQMGLWRNLGAERGKRLEMLEVDGYPLATILILTILAVAGGLALPLNLLPALRRGLPRLPWSAAAYFFLLGAGYMAVEVVLIQKTTRLVGPSAHAVAAVLAVMLLASGLGSRLAPRVGRWAFPAILVLLAAAALGGGELIDRLIVLPAEARLISAAVLVAPVAFFMGMPFPLGAARVGERVDWGFAVNGAGSVIGGTAVLLAAFAWGFPAALAGAAVLYVIAGLLARAV